MSLTSLEIMTGAYWDNNPNVSLWVRGGAQLRERDWWLTGKWTDWQVDRQTDEWMDRHTIYNNNNNNTYIALYPVKMYKLMALYSININIHLTIKKAQAL